ncbi:MAG: hypothetical protein Q8L27_00060 [archaeon]|nr:hypothetical protein [archaeon]
MAFFKSTNKKEDRKPELPALPGESRLPELPPLPSIPENKMNDSFELQAIKSTVRGNESEKKVFELGEKLPMPIRKFEQRKEPVFVKLDKFKDSVHKFDEIKSKVSDIDSTLKKIKEIRDKEEGELKAWEEKVQLIKEKVDNIDNSLFSRM